MNVYNRSIQVVNKLHVNAKHTHTHIVVIISNECAVAMWMLPVLMNVSFIATIILQPVLYNMGCYEVYNNRVCGTLTDCFQVPYWHELATKPHERDAGNNSTYGIT